MRISEFFNDFEAGKISPDSLIPFNALELHELLSEYIASIKMHRASLNETEALKKEVQNMKATLYKIDSKLSDALSAEKTQRQRAYLAEKEKQELAERLRKESSFRYNPGDIYNVYK